MRDKVRERIRAGIIGGIVVGAFWRFAVSPPVSLAETIADDICEATAIDGTCDGYADMEATFYASSAISIEDARQLVATDAAMDGIGADANGAMATMPDDSDIGRELAWLAVQMACGASDQDESLFAPDANPWAKIDNPRLANEFAIMDATLGTYGGNNAYASCTQAACGAIAAVVDMGSIKGASGCPMDMYEYLADHPETYRLIEAETLADLRPGDILACDHHTSIYVGNELAQAKFPGTDCCVYQASYQSGRSAKYPELNGLSDGDLHWSMIYRPIARNYACGYEYIDYRRIISETMQSVSD